MFALEIYVGMLGVEPIYKNIYCYEILIKNSICQCSIHEIDKSILAFFRYCSFCDEICLINGVVSH